jgi:hypothetical protein
VTRAYGTRGAADVLGILPDGKFLALEIKTGSGRLSRAQAEFIAAVNCRHGVALVVRDRVDDLETQLLRLGY